MSALEQRIAEALADASITAAALAALVIETEKRIAAADQTAELEREKAFDPMLSPDPIKARDAMEEAVIGAGRLRTLLPRLRTRERKGKVCQLT
jgi:hypothetical protein